MRSPYNMFPTQRGYEQLCSKLRARSLIELTRQVTPPTQNNRAPPPIESSRSYQPVNPYYVWTWDACCNSDLVDSINRLWLQCEPPLSPESFSKSPQLEHPPNYRQVRYCPGMLGLWKLIRILGSAHRARPTSANRIRDTCGPKGPNSAELGPSVIKLAQTWPKTAKIWRNSSQCRSKPDPRTRISPNPGQSWSTCEPNPRSHPRSAAPCGQL